MVLLFSGCVTTGQRLNAYESKGVLNTLQGIPSIIIDSDIDNVRNVVVTSMTGQGYTMKAGSNHLVSFIAPMQGSSGFFYRALAGGAYSTRPEVQVGVTLIKIPKGVKVSMSIGSSIQQGFGRTDKRDYSTGNTTAMDWLLYFKKMAEK